MISKVVDDSLCTGCGTCISICPKNAIKLLKEQNHGIYVPEVEISKCNNCQLCLKTCPAYEFDYNDFNIELYGKRAENIFVGNYNKCYTGYSQEYNVRYNSSSGGVVTEILIFALESKLIEGVLVTRMKKNNPLEPEPFIAKTKEELIEASTSKYCPVPANIVIKEILENNIKCAVVGLPCHINGIRKAEKVNKKLKDLIVLHIGLFCGYGINFSGTEILLKWLNINSEQVHKLSYRGSGWPGAVTINHNNNEMKSITLRSYYGRFFLDYGFAPKSCLLCSDLTCELSDISFGDAWLPEYSNDKIGTSIIIARNENGTKILQNAEFNKIIFLKEVTVEKVIYSQKNPIYLKKKNITARRRIMINPELSMNENLVEAHIVDYIIAYYFLLNQYLSTKPYFRKLLLNDHAYYIIKSVRFIFNRIYTKKAISLLERNND